MFQPHQKKRKKEENYEPIQYWNPAETPKSYYEQPSLIQSMERKQSTILDIRNANNWCKAILIQEVIHYWKTSTDFQNDRKVQVMDWACGKGGDLLKWNKVSKSLTMEYWGFDISESSIQDAIKRYEKAKCSFRGFFFPQNLSESIPSPVLQGGPGQGHFHLISCQFALQYIPDLKHFFSMANHFLESGGYLFGIMTNGDRIKEDSFNDLYSVSRHPSDNKQIIFSLKEAVDKVPEYIYTKQDLQTVAASCNLELCVWLPVPDFIDHYKGIYRKTYDEKVNFISSDCKDVLKLYNIFIFRKDVEEYKP